MALQAVAFLHTNSARHVAGQSETQIKILELSRVRMRDILIGT